VGIEILYKICVFSSGVETSTLENRSSEDGR
jgi:hypothetical protein